MIPLTSPNPSKEYTFPDDMPSTAWFAVRALEGFTSAKDLLASGRINKPDIFKQVDKSDECLQCWRCGGDIHHRVNDGYCTPYKPRKTFRDHWECKAKNGNEQVCCVACEAVTDRVYHPNFKLNALYTQNKVYQLTLDEDLISFLINPPSPPYLFCMGETDSQHMCWLSRYTLDNRLMAVTKGRTWGLINRENALNVATELKKILDLTNTIRELVNDKAIPLATPLLSSRKEINTIDSTNLQLSRSIYAASAPRESDSSEIKAFREQLTVAIEEFEGQPYCYLTWYVATMYLKAMLTDFTPKPISDWKQLKAPKQGTQ